MQRAGQAAARVARRVPRRRATLTRDDWLVVARRVWHELGDDDVPMLSAGVAFYGFLAIFPAIVATLLVYGSVADPDQVQRLISALSGVLPSDAKHLVVKELSSLRTRHPSVGLGLLVSVSVALWSASTGVAGMMKAINVAYDADERRRFVVRRGIALLLTLGSLVFVLVAVGLVAVVPALIEAAPGLGPGTPWLRALRWVLLPVVFASAVGVMYRVGPVARPPRLRWTSLGSLVATAVWLAASSGFSFYVDHVGRYASTYRGFGGVAVMLLWLFATAFAVLLGAEVDAETQRRLDERRAGLADLPGGGQESPDRAGSGRSGTV